MAGRPIGGRASRFGQEHGHACVRIGRLARVLNGGPARRRKYEQARAGARTGLRTDIQAGPRAEWQAGPLAEGRAGAQAEVWAGAGRSTGSPAGGSMDRPACRRTGRRAPHMRGVGHMTRPDRPRPLHQSGIGSHTKRSTRRNLERAMTRRRSQSAHDSAGYTDARSAIIAHPSAAHGLQRQPARLPGGTRPPVARGDRPPMRIARGSAARRGPAMARDQRRAHAPRSACPPPRPGAKRAPRHPGTLGLSLSPQITSKNSRSGNGLREVAGAS